MLDDIPWLETNDSGRFKERLIGSQPTVDCVANWYRAQGYEVRVPEISVRPHRGAWRAHSDKGDFFVKMEGSWVPMEVKGRRLDFKSSDDYPFRDGVLVCHCRAFDEANPKPLCIHTVNKARTHVARIFSRTSAQWFTRLIIDGEMDDVQQLCYIAPLACVEFLEMT